MPGDAIGLQIIRLTGAIVAALGTLAGAASVLKVPEFGMALSLIQARVRGAPGP
jgi:hypothetical protein